MSDKTVRIEYEFIGDDNNLSSKIDEINRKIDALGDRANEASKDIDGLTKHSGALKSTIDGSSGSVDKYNQDLKQMQRELNKAVADVNELNKALQQQQKIMQSFNGKTSVNTGAVNNQKQLNQIAEKTVSQLDKIARLQHRISGTGIDIKNVPSFKKLESSLSNVNKEMEKVNTLSNKLSNGSNNRKINNLNVKNAPFNQVDTVKTIGKKKTDAQIAKEFDRGKFNAFVRNNPDKKYINLQKRLSDTSSDLLYHNQKIGILEDKKEKASVVDKVNLDGEIYKWERQRKEVKAKYDKYQADAMKAMGLYTKDGFKVDNSAKKIDIPSLEGKRNYRKTKSINQETKAINQETKAIEKETKAIEKEILNKLKNKTLKDTTKNNDVMSNVSNSANELNDINLQTSTNAVNEQLEAQKQLNAEKMKTLELEKQIADANNETARINKENTEKQIQATENSIQQQQELLEKQKRNIDYNEKSQARAEANKTAETQKRVALYEDSKERQHQSSRQHAKNKREDTEKYNKQKAYRKAVEQAPDEFDNLITEYNHLDASLKDKKNQIEKLNKSIQNKMKEGYLKEDDYDRFRKSSTGHIKALTQAEKKFNTLSQRANRLLDVTGNEARKVASAKLVNTSTGKYSTKEYRPSIKGQTVLGRTTTFDNVKTYKPLVKELTTSTSRLEGTMLETSIASINAGKSMLRFKNTMNGVGNKIQGVGAKTVKIGEGVGKLGNGFLNAGNNLQTMSNELRGFAMIASSAFALAGQQGIEFDKSIAGIASALDKITVNKDGTVTVMTDIEFDDTINKISETAREQARKSIYDANEIAEAYRYTTLAGWSASESMESMEALINYATAGRVEGSQFAGMIDDIANSLASLNMVYEGIDLDGDGVFDDRVRKNADDMAESVTKLTDVMSKAQAISTLDPNDLVEFYKKGGSQLSSFGLTLEEVTAMASTLANRGIKGSTAAIGASSLMANLTGKTGQAKKALDEIKEKTGVDIYAWDKNGQYIGIENHLSKLSEAFTVLKKKYGTEYGVDNLQLAQLLGGKHHFKSLTKLIEGYQSGEFTETLITLQNSQGATAEMAEITNQSTWAQLKMTLSEVKEAMLSVWEAVEPTFLKMLEFIREVARAFTSLSDEQKQAIAKWLAIVVAGTLFISVLAGILTILGAVTKGIGGLIVGLGKGTMIFGSFVSGLLNLKGGIGFFTKLSPALGKVAVAGGNVAGAFSSITGAFKGFMASIGGGLYLGVVVASFVTLIFLINNFVKGFKKARQESTGFFDLLGKTILNAGKYFEQSFVDMGNWIVENVFKIDVNEASKKIASAFIKIIDFVDKFFNGLTFGLAGKFNDMLLKAFGLDGLKEHIMSELEYTAKNGNGKTKLFNSSLDEEAQKLGYKDNKHREEVEKSQNKKEKVINVINTIFDGEETGAFSALMSKIEGAEDTTVTLTVEDIQKDAGSYRALMSSIKNSKDRKIELETELKINENNLKRYNQQLKELKEKINTTTNEKTKKALKEQYNAIKEKRDLEIDLRLSNEEQLQSTIDDLTKKEEKEVVINTTYKENGKEDELKYESEKGDFEKLHGSKLSYTNLEEDKKRAIELYNSIPDMRRQLELQLQVANSPEEFNEIYYMIEELEEMETYLPIYLELIEKQDVVKTTKEKMEEATKAIEEAKKNQEEILSRTGKKDSKELRGADLTAYENENKIIEQNTKLYEENLKIHKEAEEAIGNLNGGDLQPVYDLWERLYQNYDKPMIKLFDDKEIALLERLGIIKGENNPKPVNKTETKEENGQITQTTKIADKDGKVDSIDLTKPAKDKKPKEKHKYDTVEVVYEEEVISKSTVGDKKPESITFKDSGKENSAKTEEKKTETSNKNTESTNTNTQSTTSNTQAVNENTNAVNNNKQAIEEQNKTVDEANNKEFNTEGATEFADKMDETSKTVGDNISEITNGIDEISKSISNLQLDGISEVFLTIYTSIKEAREALSNIAGFAVNTGLNSFITMGEGLKTSIESARTALMNVSGVANNYGKNSLTNMGQSLETALGGARDKLLSIANVAYNRGSNAMSSMGNALTSALTTAEGIVSRIAGNVTSLKQQIASIKMPAVPSSVNTGAPANIATMPATTSALRAITNNSISNSIANTSNFNFNMSNIGMSNKQEVRNTAKILTTHLKRRGF